MDMADGCEIRWDTLPPQEWEARFAQIPRPNLLQSYDYAQAVCPLHRLRARWGVIMMDGCVAGLVQILEAGVFKNALHAVMLDRGPLWFDGFGNAVHVENFFRAFNREFPRRFGRRRRIIPEIPDTPVMRGVMVAAGFRRLPRPGYQTAGIDLANNTENIWEGMESAWRNKVRKAEKAGLMLEWDDQGKEIPSLLMIYQSEKATKGYDGPSVALLQSMAGTFLKGSHVLAGLARKEGQAVAAVLIFCHGAGATYQVGWSTGEGKSIAAHNLLLWNAVGILKNKGIRYFDLGGVNDETAQGVKKFKQGMGGEMLTLAGHYI